MIIQSNTAARTSSNPLATRKALQLDRQGRVLHQVLTKDSGMDGTFCSMATDEFFTDHVNASQREELGELYREGVRQGELYHFVDVTVKTREGSVEVTLLLYYHEPTRQGWVFAEPQHSPTFGKELRLACVA